MAKKYYLKDAEGKVTGPYSGETLRHLAKDGVLSPSSEVSTDQKHWTKAAKVQNLFTDLDAALSAHLSTERLRDPTRQEQLSLFLEEFVVKNEAFQRAFPWLKAVQLWWAKLTAPTSFVIAEFTAAGVRHVRHDLAGGESREISQAEMNKQVSAGAQRIDWFVWLVGILAAIWFCWTVVDLVQATSTFRAVLGLVLKTLIFVVPAVAAFILKLKRTRVFVGYILDPTAKEKLQDVAQAFHALKNCSRVWVYQLQKNEGEMDWKYNAGDSFTVAKLPAAIFNRPIPNLETNIRVYGVTQLSTAVYFLPENMLVIESGQVRTVEYTNLHIDCRLAEYVEMGGNIFKDSEVIDRRWKFINRDGSRDKRFKDNVELPVVRCGILKLDVGPTRVKLMTTQSQAPAVFQQKLARSLSANDAGHEGNLPVARSDLPIVDVERLDGEESTQQAENKRH